MLHKANFFRFFDKNYFSIMDVDEIMKALPAGTQNIILMGIETHICIQQTAIDLLANGYQVYIPVDCVSAGSKEDHETGLLRMRQEGAWMSTSESLMMEMLRQASGPVFKEISNLLKNGIMQMSVASKCGCFQTIKKVK